VPRERSTIAKIHAERIAWEEIAVAVVRLQGGFETLFFLGG
jgi:hypothetical protein